MKRLAELAGLAALIALPAAAQTGPSVIVFPADKPEAVDQSVADTFTASLRGRVEATHLYDAMVFNAKSPLVVRAVQSNSLTQTQVAGPFDLETSSSVAKAVGADFALVSSVEDASADAAAGSGKVTVTVQLVNASTSRAVKSAGVSGSASSKGLAADALVRLAADNAAEKAIAQMFPQAAGTTTGVKAPRTKPVVSPAGLPTGSLPVEHKKRGKNALLILGGVALVGIIIAASGGSGSSSNSGGGPPPLPF
jgi:hypothetical protein